MSSDPTIIGCLSVHTKGEDIQLFAKVIVSYASDENDGGGAQTEHKECYLCVGRHHLFFVGTDFIGLVVGEQLPYLAIEKVTVNTTTRIDFAIMLNWQTHPEYSWPSQSIFINTQSRTLLIERIGMCWQAEVMFRHFRIEKFPLEKAPYQKRPAIDTLRIRPWKDFKPMEDAVAGSAKRADAQDPFTHCGYGFFLRNGFGDTEFANGTYVLKEAFDTTYDSLPVRLPEGTQVQIYVHDMKPIMKLEGAEEIRMVAAQYKHALLENISHFYVMMNGPYHKRMNRTSDIAMWDGWEFLIRTQEGTVACIILRRQYIPPLCDQAQDIAVMLHCPPTQKMSQPMIEVIMEECRTIADTLSPVEETAAQPVYRDIIQARLDALQFDENAYAWLQGALNMTPVHRPAAVSFVKSIAMLLHGDKLLEDIGLLDALGADVPYLTDPLQVPANLLADAAPLLLPPDQDPVGQNAGFLENKGAWHSRIARYFAYCLDGGLVGDRFTLGLLVSFVGQTSNEVEKTIKEVIEYLLNVNWQDKVGPGRLPLAQLLQDPSDFHRYTFNERVMRVLMTSRYVLNEHRKKSSSTSASYEKYQAAFLSNPNVGVGLRMLLCRQILESASSLSASSDENAHNIKVLVMSLLHVMEEKNISLATCATAALVNLSCGQGHTKTVLMSQGCLKICMDQLKMKDDDLTLYTLYLLVNMTKTPHQRQAVVHQGGVPLVVDILTSSYQNPWKHKILAEVASIIGQMCNDPETRNLLSDDSIHPVVSCLLWIFDSAPVNSKLKSKVLFALRQLCGLDMNKEKVGRHAIPRVMDELCSASPTAEECAMNLVLLLITLANIHTNASMMSMGGAPGRLEEVLELGGLQEGTEGSATRSSKGFSLALWAKVQELKIKVQKGKMALLD